MTTAAQPHAASPTANALRQFLETYEREHRTTMRVLRAFPSDQMELRPHPRCKTARELAWIFVVERGLGRHVVIDDAFAGAGPKGAMPEPPAKWEDILSALEKEHHAFADEVRALSEEKLAGTVKFFVAPKTLGDVPRMDFLWFLLHDQIHHRGQFSIYLRMAGAKVPSIYGPSGDEPWM